MAVSKRGDSWQARVEYRDSAGRVHKLTGTAQTKAGARLIEARLLRKRDEIRAGGSDGAPAHVPTFAEALAQFEQWRGCSDKVLEKHRSHMNSRLASIADIPMDRLTRAMLSDLQVAIAGSAYSTAVRNEALQLVRSVCRYYSAVTGAPDASLLMHALPARPDEVLRREAHPVWTPAQFDEFAQCVDDIPMRDFFTILFWTGMRRGELIALYRDDVDVRGRRLHVWHSQRNSTQPRGTTKARNARWITIDDVTWEAVMRAYDSSVGPYLFGGDTPYAPTTIDRWFNTAQKKALALDPDLPVLTVHGLRHSHATWLINSGANIVAVSKRLGHSTVMVTLETYTHLLDATNDQLIDALNAYRHGDTAQNAK